MSYQIKVGNKVIKDSFYALAPANWVLKFFVLSSVKREHNKLVPCWSWFRTFTVLGVMLTINIIFFMLKVQRFENNVHGQLKFIDSLQLTYIISFMEYIVDLHFVSQMRHSMVKYIQFYANIDKVLGVQNFLRMRTKILTNVLILITSFTISSLFDFVTWGYAYDWVAPILYSLDYVYGFINSLTILDVVSNVIQIQFRVRSILDHIEAYYASSLVLGGEMDDIDFETVATKKVDRLSTVSHTKSYGILSLSKSYVMIMEQVQFINTAYGIRLGAFCLNLLIYLVYLINVIIRMILGQFSIPYPLNHLTTASTVLRTVNGAAIFLGLVYHCEQTYKLCGGIVRLVDLTLVNKKIPNEMSASLMELRALVLSRPVGFHGANFFSLDYKLLVSLSSVVVTYSIILLQSMR